MKSLRSKLKIALIVFIAITLVAVGTLSFLAYANNNIMFWEFPKNLSNKTETIEVTYVMWACACANWLPLPRTHPESEIKDSECIFIEAATENLIVPDSFYTDYLSKKVRLTGSYYTDKGISRTYEMPTSQRPEKAKVFRYTEIEILDK